jgi:hypothetical protein
MALLKGMRGYDENETFIRHISGASQIIGRMGNKSPSVDSGNQRPTSKGNALSAVLGVGLLIFALAAKIPLGVVFVGLIVLALAWALRSFLWKVFCWAVVLFMVYLFFAHPK